MGGVDVANIHTTLYRITVKTRWWYIKVSWYCVDICKVNAWLLYCHYCDLSKIAKRRQLNLLKLSLQIFEGVVKGNKSYNVHTLEGTEL